MMRQYTTYEFALFFLLLFSLFWILVCVYIIVYIFCGNKIHNFTIEKTDCFMSVLNSTLKIVWNRKQESNTSKCKRLFFPRMILAFTQRTMFLLWSSKCSLSSSLFLRMSTVCHNNSIVSFLNIISLDSVCKYKTYTAAVSVYSNDWWLLIAIFFLNIERIHSIRRSKLLSTICFERVQSVNYKIRSCNLTDSNMMTLVFICIQSDWIRMFFINFFEFLRKFAKIHIFPFSSTGWMAGIECTIVLPFWQMTGVAVTSNRAVIGSIV